MFPILLALWGCGSSSPADTGAAPLPARGDCNPVEGTACMLPFPSDVFEATDASTPSGMTLDIGPTSMPINLDGVQLDPESWNEKDGWSTLGTLYMHLPGALTDGAPTFHDREAYADSDVATVILDAETGERLPHFIEREVQADDPSRALMMLHPLSPMRHAARYVVGVRGLVDEDGAVVAAPEGFAALRDDTPIDDPDIERQRAHYEDDIFPVLDAAGFERDELQLAWSFTTVSAEGSLGEALWLRDDALSRVGDAGPSYTIDQVDEGDCAGGDRIARTLSGTMSAPLYLTTWDPGSVLYRDDQGAPAYNGQVDVPFTVRLPCSLVESGQPGRVIQYGHGLLGGQEEVRSGFLDQIADDGGFVLIATDWTGMKSEDAAYIALMMVEDPSSFRMLPERLLQGFVEALSAGRMIRGDLAQDPELQVDGTSLVDTGPPLLFYGVSQGGVLGGGYVALSPDIERAVFGVPGMPFTLLLERAEGFQPFLTLIQGMYGDWADISVLIGLFQTLWDPAEAAGYAWFMNQQPLDADTPNKDVLIQAAIGDTSVPTVGAHVMARAYQASLIAPATRPIMGLEEREPPFQGSAIVEFDYGVEDPDQAQPGDPDTNPHNRPRGSAEGIAQVITFMTDGTVENYCDGACDPN